MTLASSVLGAFPGHVVGQRLALIPRAGLFQTGLGLMNLLVQFGSLDFRQKLPGLHRVADVHHAVQQVSVRPGPGLGLR